MDAEEGPVITDKPKKRQRSVSAKEKAKRQRLSAHETGEDCSCKKQCFNNISVTERSDLIHKFNSFESKDLQDSYLCSFIICKPVLRRRSRKEDQESQPNNSSYSYIIKFMKDETLESLTVCYKAFLSLFGITPRRVQTLKQALLTTGLPPTDKRGTHHNRPNKMSNDTESAVLDHIKSFRGRKSHYALGDTRKLYLSEELNVSKMHKLYKEKYPNNPVSYELYRRIVTTKFNIGFGYPRKDTCTVCDIFEQRRQGIESELSSSSGDQNDLLKQQETLKTELELHQRKAQTFYKRKTEAKKRAKTDHTMEALVFDYQKNLPVPNKSSNDVYYKRQLSFHSFNVHRLSDDSAYFFSYDETIARKGSDEVCSMLHYYLNNVLSPEVSDIELFCDGCSGQNKNYTLFRFLHWLVHTKKRFRSIIIRFPIRGHSYLECDRDMAIVNQSTQVDVPDDWINVIETARVKPSPFNVVKCDTEFFLNFNDHLKSGYKATSPFKTRPVRELIVNANSSQLVFCRESWNGSFLSYPITAKGKRSSQLVGIPQLYTELIPLKQAKYKDLQTLKNLYLPKYHNFYDSLPVMCLSANDVHEDGASDNDDDSL